AAAFHVADMANDMRAVELIAPIGNSIGSLGGRALSVGFDIDAMRHGECASILRMDTGRKPDNRRHYACCQCFGGHSCLSSRLKGTTNKAACGLTMKTRNHRMKRAACVRLSALAASAA